jgi:hypothetical protein
VLVEQDILNGIKRSLLRSYSNSFVRVEENLLSHEQKIIKGDVIAIMNFGATPLSKTVEPAVLRIISRFHQNRLERLSPTLLLVRLELNEQHASYLQLLDIVLFELQEKANIYPFRVSESPVVIDYMCAVVTQKSPMYIRKVKEGDILVDASHPSKCWHFKGRANNTIPREKLLNSPFPTDDKLVNVALLDSGYTRHSLMPTSQVYSGISDDTFPISIPLPRLSIDLNGHGTQLMGLVSSHAYGVTNGRDDIVKCFMLQVGTEIDGKVLISAQAVDDCLAYIFRTVPANEMLVINCSINVWYLAHPLTRARLLDALNDPVRKAHLVIIVAAGNDSKDLDEIDFLSTFLDHPHVRENVLFIGASDENGELCCFSNRSTVTRMVLAPGSRIISIDIEERGKKWVQVLLPDKEFVAFGRIHTNLAGTSHAAAIVSGLLATVARLNPTWDALKLIGSIVGPPVKGSEAMFYLSFPFLDPATSAPTSLQQRPVDSSIIWQSTMDQGEGRPIADGPIPSDSARNSAFVPQPVTRSSMDCCVIM